MINIDEYEKYIKETNWKEHEYINNLLSHLQIQIQPSN